MARVSWYRHMSMALWEVFLPDPDMDGRYVRVGKGVIYDVDELNEMELLRAVMRAAATWSRPTRRS